MTDQGHPMFWKSSSVQIALPTYSFFPCTKKRKLELCVGKDVWRIVVTVGAGKMLRESNHSAYFQRKVLNGHTKN